MSITWARSLSNGQCMYWSLTMKVSGIHSEDVSLDLPQGEGEALKDFKQKSKRLSWGITRMKQQKCI